MTTGEKIAALRREHKLSQEALGEKLGLSRQAVSKWEADQAVPTMDNLMELSRLFGVPVDTLLRPDAPFPAAPAEDGAGKESEDTPAAPETPSAPRQPRRSKSCPHRRRGAAVRVSRVQRGMCLEHGPAAHRGRRPAQPCKRAFAEQHGLLSAGRHER